MGRTKKIMAGAAIAAASVVALPAAPAMADLPSDDSNGLITFSQDGDLLPICIHTVRITLFGTTLLDLPEICIG